MKEKQTCYRPLNRKSRTMAGESNSENIKYRIPAIVHVFMTSQLVSFCPIALLKQAIDVAPDYQTCYYDSTCCDIKFLTPLSLISQSHLIHRCFCNYSEMMRRHIMLLFKMLSPPFCCEAVQEVCPLILNTTKDQNVNVNPWMDILAMHVCVLPLWRSHNMRRLRD